MISLRCALWVCGQEKLDDLDVVFLCLPVERESALVIRCDQGPTTRADQAEAALLCCPVEREVTPFIGLRCAARVGDQEKL